MEGDLPENTDRRRQDEDGENNNGGRQDIPRIGGQKPSTPPSTAAERKEHVCADCGKVFSSGKALGGHMSSAHVQAGRDYSYKKKKKTPLRRGAAAVSDEDEEAADEDEDLALREYYRGIDGKIRCNLCGKRFPSRKSLFGHMRCHPERGYRGMEPPIDDGEDSGEEDRRRRRYLPHQPPGGASIELETLLWSWSVKGTRGRPPIPPAFSSSSSFSRDEVKLHRAVKSLVSLVKADSPSPKNPNNNHGEKRNCLLLGAGNGNGFPNKGKGKVVWEPRFRSGEKSSSEEDEGEEEEEEEEEADMTSSDEDEEEELGMALVNLKNFPTSLGASSSSKNNKRRKTTSGDFAASGWRYSNCGGEEDNNNNKFKCSTCNKCFTSHQALGGHRSSHNKFKVIIQNAIDAVEEVDEDHHDDGEEDDDCAIGHQCGVCNKTFATRRALGGHKKRHSASAAQHSSSSLHQNHQQQQQLIMVSAAAAVATSSSSSPPQRAENRKIVLDFDLNEIPDDMDAAQIE